MKRRMISLVMVLLILCGLLTACGQQSTAEVLDAALDKTAALDAMSARMEIGMDMTSDGITMSIPMTIDLKAKDVKSDDPIIWVLMSTEMLGQSLEVEVYQEDHWAYMVTAGMKYKTKAEDAADEFDYADDMLQELPEALLEGVELVKNDDGSQTAAISVPDGQFADIYDDFIESIYSGAEVDVSQLQISNAVVTITVDDGYVTVYDMAFTMEMTVEGVTTKTEVTASITFDDPGGAVEITPPEGYQDFEEQDLG